MTDNNIMNIITQTYVTCMTEFFTLIQQSDVMKEQMYPINSLCIGINAIHRVFEYVFFKTKNAERALYYSKKTYYYYLEYMEQIYKSNLSANLNHTDVILFVYKKTIIELHDGEPDMLSNMMVSNEELMVLDENEWRTIFNKISSIVNLLFYGANPAITLDDRIHLLDTYLIQFLNNINQVDDILVLIEWIQLRNDVILNLTFPQYDAILRELTLRFRKKKHVHRKSIITDEHLFSKFYVEKNRLHNFLQSGTTNIKELVQWLYEPHL